MPLPSGVKVEIEFEAETWTDATADVDYRAGFSIRVGRTSPSSAPQVSSVTVTLANSSGKYTPGVSTLKDGTAAPYWPNVQIRKRLRISNSAGVRFVGGIKSWLPLLDNGVLPRVTVTANDLTDRLSRVTLLSVLAQEITVAGPSFWWPLTDAEGSTQAVERTGNGQPLKIGAPSEPALAFGADGPGVEDGACVLFAPTIPSTNPGQLLVGSAMLGDSWTVTAWFQIASSTTMSNFGCIVHVDFGTVDHQLTWDMLNGIIYLESSSSAEIDSSGEREDGKWHLVTATRDDSTGNVTLYVDGVSAGSTAVAASTGACTIAVGNTTAGLTFGGGRPFAGKIGQVQIYDRALSADEVAAQFAAGDGFDAELVSDRIARWLAYAGLTSADWSIDTSTVTCGTYPQSGKNVAAACQDMAVTEGGGAVFYAREGLATFGNRDARLPGDPALTISAQSDLDRSNWQPSLDDADLINRCTVSRSTAAGVQSTLIAVDQDSIDAYDIADEDMTTYNGSDSDALHLAQSVVAGGRIPGFRLSSVTVDLLTASSDLYATVQDIGIGSRLRVTNLPVAQAPATQLDVIVEGWTETVNVGAYSIAYDTSPADNPPVGIWDDDTYGRWQDAGDLTLHTALDADDTTVVIDAPTTVLTSDSGAYPLTIQIGTEQITLASAPDGSSTPQTFTGCTRAANGTTAAAQAADSAVALAPAVTWAF